MMQMKWGEKQLERWREKGWNPAPLENPIEREVDKWLHTAEQGSRLVYHSGLLMKDRQKDEALDRAAIRLQWESRQGRVQLTQSRLKPVGGREACRYIATKVR